ncbi:hypothetical protein GCM10029976_066280 [Kribbella albertanoniae]|uniref:competence protein CoiA family protein n=1 Tax=Kribbella albertanoniae TaxID=1266829 RepID=UPI001404A2BD|nr:hypothetical protein [Kribbella albertanoniae]
MVGPVGARRADVLASSPDGVRRIAWEAQLSPIADDDIRDRTARYESADVEVCWVSPLWSGWIGTVPSIRVAKKSSLVVIDSVAEFDFSQDGGGCLRT